MKTTFKSTIVKESSESQFFQEEIDIKNWLDQYNVKNYTINQDKTVTVNGDVDLSGKDLTKIPVKFSEVHGPFDISLNKLTDLSFCPEKVTGGFFVHDNELTSLVGGPKEVGESYDCDNNKLSDLQGAPEKVGKAFICSFNPLKSLNGCPKEVGKYFKAIDCGLTVIDDFPKIVGSNVHLNRNKLKTLKGINKFVKEIGGGSKNSPNGTINVTGNNELESGLLSLCSIKGLKSIIITGGADVAAADLKKAVEIINNGLKNGDDVFDIQDALIDGGVGSFC